MIRHVNAADYASDIMKALPAGVLLTTKAGDRVNTMTIGWGTIGVNWGRPVFVAYVRGSRATTGFLQKNPAFTVNIPLDGGAKKILGFCGSHSARDTDKIAEAGLTPVPSPHIDVPGLAELPLTLECRVLYQQTQVPAALPEDIRARFYPQDAPAGVDHDAHAAYYAEIVGAYIAE